jgi:ABC-2 type transport system permease protein
LTAGVHSELLKVRTTRAWWLYLLFVIVIPAIGTAGAIGHQTAVRRSEQGWQTDLVGNADIVLLVAVILGITAVTVEFRHGTITPTFLATPAREAVLAWKAMAVAALALVFAVLALATVAAVAVVWLSVDGIALHVGSALVERAVQALLVVLLGALMGLAIGTVVHGQIAAIVGTLVWLLLGETLAAALLTVVGFEGAVSYLPFRALNAAGGTAGGDLLPYAAAVSVSIVYIVVIGALGVVRTSQQDIA